jgi:hypothetical protein
MAAFQKTFHDLNIILTKHRRDLESVEYIGELWHTLDECHNFFFDYKALHGGARFKKRPFPLAPPDIRYGMARYVYTDPEIVALKRRIDF